MNIVLDFDGTITAKDTIGCLGTFAVSHQQKRSQHDLSSTWEWIVSEYVDDCKTHVSGYSPAEADRTTHQEERTFLHSLQHVDIKSLGRVADSRLFEGCTEDDLLAAGQEAVRSGKVTARHGFCDFVAAMRSAGANLSILSVNWSASFIKGVLLQSSNVVVDRIVSNEISADGTIGCSVNGDKTSSAMMTSLHKLKALEKISAATSTGEQAASLRTTIYFGDSTTDLECLLAADIGIIMSDDENSALLRALTRLGFDCPHALDGSKYKQQMQATVHPHRLIWATSFTEVLESGISLLSSKPLQRAI